MGHEIFINYRGLDSHSYAALLHTALVQQFGEAEVFLDSDSVPAGVDFATCLLDAVRSARVVLAVIGPRWLDGRRIDDPEDWIRRELAEAFQAGKVVIPVLTDDAELPAARDLPADIAAMARCQYRRLRRRDKTSDLARIVADLRHVAPWLPRPRPRRSGWLATMFDPYRRRARISPLLLVAFPVLLLVGLAFPTADTVAQAVILAVGGGLPVLADQLGRRRGKRLEPRLFESWGGPPTTQLLRWRGPASRTTQRLQHAGLGRWAGPLPTEVEEQADPVGSDERYASAVAILRASQRDRHGLAFEENCNYGFRRNMLGLRPYGFAMALLTCAGAAALGSLFPSVLLSAVGAAFGWLWLRVVTPSWVAEAAWAYAERLLEVVLLDAPGRDAQTESGAVRSVVEP